MATGTQLDIANRLRSVIPASWFPDPATNEWGFLQGFANMASWAYGLIAFAKLQTRISTASGIFLDIMALDFFGRGYGRAGQTDTAFRAGIKKEILRPRGTRPAVIQAVTDLTGHAPVVFYPNLSSDTGGYGITNTGAGGFVCGYGVSGRYGSMLMPYQALVDIQRPSQSGIAFVPGYGVTSTASSFSIGGYGVASEYATAAQVTGAVTDAQIYARVASIIPEGVIAWVGLSGASPFPPGGLGLNPLGEFALGS
jgi:hypothetical protein